MYNHPLPSSFSKLISEFIKWFHRAKYMLFTFLGKYFAVDTLCFNECFKIISSQNNAISQRNFLFENSGKITGKCSKVIKNI